MKHALPLTVLAASLSLGLTAVPCPALAQDAAAVDEAVATTPTTLAELLGPGGLDAVGTDFYLHLQMDVPGVAEGGPGLEDSVVHWRSVVEEGRLIFIMQSSDLGGGGNSKREVFTEEGEFVERTDSSTAPGYERFETAVRDGDQVRTSSFYELEGEPSEPEEEVHSFSPVADTIPMAWLPLAYAYHIREGHDRFVLHMVDDATGQVPFVQVIACEHLGTEMIQAAGSEHEAHILSLRTTVEVDGEPVNAGAPPEQTMQMYVLADGSIVRIRMAMEGMSMSADAITAEEAGVLVVGGQGGGAGEDIEEAGDAIRGTAD